MAGRMWLEALRRAELVAAGAALARAGLVRGSEGNLSCRLGPEEVLLTPAGVDKGRLAGTQLLRCRIEASPPAGASSEAGTHLAIYRAMPGVLAVVHAHPPALLSLDARGRPPDVGLLLESAWLIPSVGTVPPLTPGSAALAEACCAALAAAPAAVMSRHGVLATGGSVAEALMRVQVLELLARIELDRERRRG